ncbi:MAG: hypothetical protein JWM07_2 [Candidatus Saccharibacteria bacterium]|nr:hypothetical protein [Candidatus Saccharibacteria bacterium]
MAWIAVLLASLVALTGCGGTASAPNPPPAEQFEATSQSTCFEQMEPEQEQKLREYAEQNRDRFQESTNSAGDQSVCVLESDGNGGYNQRYYQKEDESKFDDYLLYSLLLGNSNTLLTYGALSGDLDFGQVMALSLLTGVNSRGQVYHPYTKPPESSKWSRTPSDVRGQVKTYAYGRSAAPLTFDNSKMLQVPPGFVAKPIPAASDKVVEYAKGPAGKPVVKSQSDQGAKAVIEEQKKAKQAVAPTAAPRATTGSGTSQPGGTASRGADTSTGKKVEPGKKVDPAKRPATRTG